MHLGKTSALWNNAQETPDRVLGNKNLGFMKEQALAFDKKKKKKLLQNNPC